MAQTIHDVIIIGAGPGGRGGGRDNAAARGVTVLS